MTRRALTVPILAVVILAATACGDSTDTQPTQATQAAPTTAGSAGVGDVGWCGRYTAWVSTLSTIYDDMGLDGSVQEDSRAAAAVLLPLWAELLPDAPSQVMGDVETIHNSLEEEVDPAIDWTEIAWGEYDRARDRIDAFCG